MRARDVLPVTHAAVALLVAVGTALCVVVGAARAEDRVIVAFGDSLTAGHGVATDETYPALLAARLRAEGYAYRVVNAGVSGDTTAGALRRVDWTLKLKPDVAIVEIGANDGLRGQDLASVRANLDAIVARFQSARTRVLVAGMRLPPNYGARYGTDFLRLFAEVAKRRDAALMPFFLDGVAGDARFNVDRLWPYLRPLLVK